MSHCQDPPLFFSYDWLRAAISMSLIRSTVSESLRTAMDNSTTA